MSACIPRICKGQSVPSKAVTEVRAESVVIATSLWSSVSFGRWSVEQHWAMVVLWTSFQASWSARLTYGSMLVTGACIRSARGWQGFKWRRDVDLPALARTYLAWCQNRHWAPPRTSSGATNNAPPCTSHAQHRPPFNGWRLSSVCDHFSKWTSSHQLECGPPSPNHRPMLLATFALRSGVDWMWDKIWT